MGAGGVERTELRLLLHGLGHAAAPRAEAIWRGSLVVRTVPVVDRIELMEVALPLLDVDPEIVDDLGSLLADAVRLERSRCASVKAAPSARQLPLGPRGVASKRSTACCPERFADVLTFVMRFADPVLDPQPHIAGQSWQRESRGGLQTRPQRT